jgi:PhnB protein
MSIQTYMNFNGNCLEAVKFYAKVFKTEEPKILLFGDMPSNDLP